MAEERFITTSQVLCSTVILFLVAGWIRWRRKKLRFFKDLGIPGPTPHFFLGNFPEITEKGLLNCETEWVKKYGQIVGYFYGLRPTLIVADKEILKKIIIKDFHLFSDRPDILPLRVRSILDYIIPGTRIMDKLLVNLRGEEWKRVRTRLSPIFSANKLKMMIPFVDKIFQETLDKLEQKARIAKIVNIYSMLKYATLDVIAAQAFAMNANIQKEGSRNKLYLSANAASNNPVNSKLLIFGYSFPEVGILSMALFLLKMLFECRFNIPPLKIPGIVGQVIENRRQHPEKHYTDLLQFLIDASHEDAVKTEKLKQDSASSLEHELSNTEENQKSKQRRGLSDLEIKASSLVIFLAGYETSSCALAVIIHCLAKYPKLQEKMRGEVDRCAQGKELDMDVLNNLHFMERFILEAMRFYPPVPTFVNRVAVQDVQYGNLKIPKGLLVTIPVQYLHFSEEHFEKPFAFDPDRFLMENRSRNDINTSYWAFGKGPRNCIGSRLFNITAKVILIKLLQRFSFEIPDGCSQEDMKMIVRHSTQVPEQVLVRVKELVSL